MLYSEGVEFYDSDKPYSKNHQDLNTNYIEVPGDDMTIQDIFHQNLNDQDDDQEEEKKEINFDNPDEVKILSEELLFRKANS